MLGVVGVGQDVTQVRRQKAETEVLLREKVTYLLLSYLLLSYLLRPLHRMNVVLLREKVTYLLPSYLLPSIFPTFLPPTDRYIC